MGQIAYKGAYGGLGACQKKGCPQTNCSSRVREVKHGTFSTSSKCHTAREIRGRCAFYGWFAARNRPGAISSRSRLRGHTQRPFPVSFHASREGNYSVA